MSVKTKLDVIYDLDGLEKAAADLGLVTMRNGTVGGYYGSMGTADLVIRGENSKYDVGFNTTKDGKTQIVYDKHGGSADTLLGKLIPKYVERRLKKSKFKIKKTTVDNNYIRLHVG